MTAWTSGYVTDIGYTYGYYTELNPLRCRFAFLNAGLVPPTAGVHCELGFGQGMSVNIHAAASGNEWWATDFNPAQAGFAQSMARASGANAHLFDQSFAEFCQRSDLPDFDSIGLHGIWSWISDENRTYIVDFIRRKLKVGGALYISYNTLPGFAPLVPLRHLFTEHAETMGAPGQGILARIDGALAFAEKLVATNPGYARANPQIAARLKKIVGQNRHYLAHEYFNRDWLPMHFADMARWLAPTKLDYACSAHYLDHVPGINLTADQQALLKEVPDAMLRETVRDFMINQQFRRDYWVKGAQRLNLGERIEALRTERVTLIQSRSDVSLKTTGALGEVTMQEAVYAPILDALADNRPRALSEIERATVGKANVAQLTEAITVLIGSGAVVTAQNADAVAVAKPNCDKLNAAILDQARHRSDIANLASPLTGGGIVVQRFPQLFLLARRLGKETPEEWAAHAWQILIEQGQRILKDGKALETPEANLTELTEQARGFAAKQLPLLRMQEIV